MFYMWQNVHYYDIIVQMNIIHFIQSVPVELFAISAVLLVIGLITDIWNNAIHLTFLNAESLQTVERKHPYLPSISVIGGIAICSALLFLVSLKIIGGIYSIAGTDIWIFPAVFFLILCAFGILAELKWKGARDTALGTALGTAFAFLIFEFVTSDTTALSTILSLTALMLCALAAYKLFFKSWSRTAHIVGAIVCVAWIKILFMMMF